MSHDELIASLNFKLHFHRQPCAVHDDPLDCEQPMQVAHLIPKQALRRRGLHEFVWDVRNGLSVCYRAHRRSDAGLERFPAERIPEAAWEFADEVGLRWMLERLYGEQVAA